MDQVSNVIGFSSNDYTRHYGPLGCVPFLTWFRQRLRRTIVRASLTCTLWKDLEYTNQLAFRPWPCLRIDSRELQLYCDRS